MPDVVRQFVDVVQARPLTCVVILMAAILYARLMMSGPRAR